MWPFKQKNKEEYKFPADLLTDPEGFDFLSHLLTKTAKKGQFEFNFEKVVRFEANLCAVLGSIIETNKKYGAVFSCTNINQKYLIETFKNNGFLALVNQTTQNREVNSKVPLKMFNMKNEAEVETYIYQNLLSSPKIPKMSEGARRKIYRSIFEIYQNSVMHSGADKIFVCSQFYHMKGRLSLTMVEIGRTFKHNVTTHMAKYSDFTGAQCIEWAVKSGNTTKKEDETGGLGLDLIREFLRLNDGKLQIKSANGYWEEKKGVSFAKETEHGFLGSIVNIEFNLRDTKTYYSAEEIDIKDIL